MAQGPALAALRAIASLCERQDARAHEAETRGAALPVQSWERLAADVRALSESALAAEGEA